MVDACSRNAETLGDRNMAATAPLSNARKVTSLAIGMAGGLGTSLAMHTVLPSPEAEKRLEAAGISTISHREMNAKIAPIALIASAAIGTGIGRRSESAALTTASLGAAALLASTGASTMVNADNDSADEFMRTLGLMSGVAAGAFAIGAMDEIPLNRAKLIGLGLVGFAAGGFLPETARYLVSLPQELHRSYQNRDA
jgi:hypothetical protein